MLVSDILLLLETQLRCESCWWFVDLLAGSTATTGTSPSHQVARERSESQEETDEGTLITYNVSYRLTN